MKLMINEKTRESYVQNMVQNLPMLRAKLGMTQAQLAQRIGLTRQTVTALENGKTNLSWTNYLALCFLFENNSETSALLELYDICPEILRNYLGYI